MTRADRVLRAAGAVFSSVALAGAGLLVAAPAAEAAACTSTSSGVTVVVTFPDGSTSVRCAPGDPSSGAAALQGAGFSITQVQTMPGFICRIDGAPASDPCVRTPPTSAYWSSWYAQPGGGWTYSSAGAYGRDPAPGSVEGWSFGAGSPPAVSPPSVSAPAPPPPPPPPPASSAPAPSSPASSSGSSSSAPGTTAASPGGAGTAQDAPAGTAGSTGAPEAQATESPTEAPTEEAGEEATEEATDQPTRTRTATAGADEVAAAGPDEIAGDSDAGSSAGAITGIGVAGALLAAAGWMGWRRRTGE